MSKRKQDHQRLRAIEDCRPGEGVEPWAGLAKGDYREVWLVRKMSMLHQHVL